MSREIKFKIWDTLNKHFCPINIDCYTIKWQGDIWLISASEHYDPSCFPFARLDSDRFKILQFTGIKDKNGKEIYEGDIVKMPQRTHVKYAEVVYKEYYSAFQIENRFVREFLQFNDVIVVGNIFENPELLK